VPGHLVAEINKGADNKAEEVQGRDDDPIGDHLGCCFLILSPAGRQVVFRNMFLKAGSPRGARIVDPVNALIKSRKPEAAAISAPRSAGHRER
jgi:hypothetical protein